jgi:putative endonuclease
MADCEAMMKNSHPKAIGKWGENLAKEYLIKAGCEVLGGNVRMESGEIDLIVRCNEVICFIEVKTRRNLAYGFPEESITEEKFSHMVDSAYEYLQENPSFEDSAWRIDVISIIGSPDNSRPPQIKWFQNVSV